MMGLARRNILAGLAAAPFATSAVSAEQLHAACEIDDETRDKLNDWPNLARYAAENNALLASARLVDVVFMGDSITQGWPDKRPAYFREGRVCRGIGGQTTPQMVLRMMADVIALKPQLVHIMAGTNDIAGNTGPMTTAQTIDNLESMVVLARSFGIKVMVGSVPPAANFPWRPELETARAISTLNDAISGMAKKRTAIFVDYTSSLSDGMGGMKKGYAYDGVHPDVKGYAAMEAVLEPIIAANCTQLCRKRRTIGK